MLLQQKWAPKINPVLDNQLVQGELIQKVSLAVGANTFNHYLGRQMTGWLIVDQNALATIYRSQPLNSQTLTLTSSAIVTVALWVF